MGRVHKSSRLSHTRAVSLALLARRCYIETAVINAFTRVGLAENLMLTHEVFAFLKRYIENIIGLIIGEFAFFKSYFEGLP